jgi:glycosyltransferase involved in cell wall biosynthesis
MKIIFWISLTIVLYTYAGYPGIMYLMARFRPHPWRRSPMDAPVSIIMAVHNGAVLLQDKIDHLATLDPACIREVIIVSDGSSDATAQILSDMWNPRFHPIILKEQCGKAIALNHGIAAASGEILLFVDIRPQIASGALTKLLSNFADPSVGCVAGELLLKSAGHDAATGAISGVYWRYEQWIRNCEAVWDSPVGVYGGFYAARRLLVTPFPAGIILDDMFQPLAILRQGYRSVLDRTACVVDSWPERVEGEFQRKVRTLAGNYQLISLAPWILSGHNRVLFQLVSHKLLRLLVPYLFLLMLLSASWMGTYSLLWTTVAALQWSLWLVSLLALRAPLPVIQRFAASGSALLVLNAAAVAGLYNFLFAPKPLWKIWSATVKPRKQSLPAA